MHDPVVGAPETVLHEDRIGFGGEVAVGEEQQLDTLANRLLARRSRIGLGFAVLFFYVSHVDLSGNLRYNPDVFYDIKFPGKGGQPNYRLPTQEDRHVRAPLRYSHAGRFER